MGLIITTSHAQEHGIEISSRGFPSLAGEPTPGQYWIVGVAAVTPTSEHPDLPVRPGAVFKGTAVVATSPTGLLVVVSAGADPTKGIVLRADRGGYAVESDGMQGVFTKRPRLIELETPDWMVAMSQVNKLLRSVMQGKAEAEFLSELRRGAGR